MASLLGLLKGVGSAILGNLASKVPDVIGKIGESVLSAGEKRANSALQNLGKRIGVNIPNNIVSRENYCQNFLKKRGYDVMQLEQDQV